MRNLLKHLFEYLLVLLIMTAGLVSLWLVEEKAVKILVSISFSALYFLWGVGHCAREHDLQLSTLWEYLVLSLLILFVLLSLIRF